MDIKQIASAGWTNRDAAPALAPLVRQMIDDRKITQAAPQGSTLIILNLLPDATPAQQKNLTAHLQAARKAGLLAEYFTPHPTKKLFGSPLIQWGKV